MIGEEKLAKEFKDVSLYKIKELEWEEKLPPTKEGNGLWESNNTNYKFVVFGSGGYFGLANEGTCWDTFDEAKQACQEHSESLMKQGLEEV